MIVFPKHICKRILPDTGESRSDKTFFLKTNMALEMVARVFMHCPLDSRASLNHDSLWFPPLSYSFFDLSARGEPTRHRATNASNHAQPNQGTTKIRGTGCALSRPAPACPRTTWLIKRRQRSLRRRRLHCRPQATKNKSFMGPQYIVRARKKEKAKGPNPFFAFQVPFWFPALRSSILSSAMVVVAFQHHLHKNAFSLLFFLVGLLSDSLFFLCVLFFTVIGLSSCSIFFFSSWSVIRPTLSFPAGILNTQWQ